jgi:hypothetical protein
MVGRAPQTTVDMLSKLGRSNAKLANSAKEDYNILAQGIQNNAPESIRRFNEIRQYFPNVTGMKDVTPEMVFGLTFYRKKPQASTIDRSIPDDEYQRIKDITNINTQREKQAAKEAKAGEVLDSHPSVVIRSVMEQVPAVTGEEGGKTTFTGVDVSRQFAGFDMKGSENKMSPIKNVRYIAGGEGTELEPYFNVTLEDESNFKLQPNALNTRIVASMPDITFKGGAVSIPKIGKAATKAKTPAKAPAKKLSYSGLDDKGNPIYK